MKAIHSSLTALAGVAMLVLTPLTGAAGFVDPLDAPAQQSALAAKSLMQAVARAGLRLVAVGQRGHIVYRLMAALRGSRRRCQSLRSDCRIFRQRPEGLDGRPRRVILHTSDGGLSWTTQLDGRRANERLVEYMQERVNANPQAADKKQLLEEAKRYKEQGADKPFLDVWFADETNGYVVGAYNLIFHTRDGGKNWEPWFDQRQSQAAEPLRHQAGRGRAVYRR